MSDFNRELQTIPIDDFELVESAETKSPFSEKILPQGSIPERFNLKGKTAKFKYIEHGVHGRTIDEKSTSAKVLWGGKYKCDKFGARDLKGARHEAPALVIDKKAGYPDVRALGLYDETDVTYLIKASEFLRSNGIPTENIVNIYKINEIIFDGKPMQIKEWLLHNIVGHIARQKAQNIHDPDEIKLLTDFAYDTEFFQVERELQVSERIRDLSLCQTREEFLDIINGPLKWLNTVAKATNEGVLPNSEKPDFFDIQNEEDIRRYLENWLPSQMGVYLARCRKAGVRNDFDHAQQWSLAATLYDSQSFVGEKLNGEKLTETDFVETINNALGILEELFSPANGNYISTTYGDNGESLEQAKVNLLINYFKEIEFPNIENPNSYNYSKLVDNTFFNGYKYFPRTLKPETYIKAINTMGLSLSTEQKQAIFNIHEKVISALEAQN